jgi:hypothetical protein
MLPNKATASGKPPAEPKMTVRVNVVKDLRLLHYVRVANKLEQTKARNTTGYGRPTCVRGSTVIEADDLRDSENSSDDVRVWYAEEYQNCACWMWPRLIQCRQSRSLSHCLMTRVSTGVDTSD